MPSRLTLGWLSLRKQKLERLLKPDGIFIASFEQGEVGPDLFRAACSWGLISKFSGASYFGVPLGTFDDGPGVRPELHVHVESKAPWFTITDDLPQLPAGPK